MSKQVVNPSMCEILAVTRGRSLCLDLLPYAGSSAQAWGGRILPTQKDLERFCDVNARGGVAEVPVNKRIHTEGEEKAVFEGRNSDLGNVQFTVWFSRCSGQ